MRAAAKKSKSSPRKFPTPSLGERSLPAALAIVGFLVTYTVRSWDQGFWPQSQVVDHAIATRVPDDAHEASIGAHPIHSAPFASVLTKVAAISRVSRVAPESPTPSVAPADARHYLADRDREEDHGRLR
jgi:hypothetical protein